jgi:hypothetical protein
VSAKSTIAQGQVIVLPVYQRDAHWFMA